VSSAYEFLVGEPEGRMPLGKPRHNYEENIKVDIEEISYECVCVMD
jgi:hypothetical protein